MSGPSAAAPTGNNPFGGANPFAGASAGPAASNPFATDPLGTDPLAPGPKPITGLYEGPATAPERPGPAATRQPAAARPPPQQSPPRAVRPAGGAPVAAQQPTPAPAPPEHKAASDRCPDCGRMVIGGACLACGWRADGDRAVKKRRTTGRQRLPPQESPQPPAQRPAPAQPQPPAARQPRPAAPPEPARPLAGPPAQAARPTAPRTPPPVAPDVPARPARPTTPAKKPSEDGPFAMPSTSVRNLAAEGPSDSSNLRLAALGTVAFLLTVLVVWALWPSAGDVDGATKMEGAAARAVIASTGAIPDDRRDGDQWLQLAHAHASVGELEAALGAYGRASRLDSMDLAGRRFCIAQLGHPYMRDAAIKVLTDFPSGTGVDQALIDVLDHESITIRNNALKVLLRRGTATVNLQVDVAIRDMLTGSTCAERRSGLARLDKLKSAAPKQEALDAIQQIEDRIGNEKNSCMILELKRVKKAIAGG